MATKKTTKTIKKTSPKKTVNEVTETAVTVKAPRGKSKLAESKVSSRRRKEIEIETVDDAESSKFPIMGGRKIGKRTIALAATLIVLGGLLYLAGRYAVVAWVDNRPITRFELYSELEKTSGKELTEQLILQNLIRSEGKQKGIVLSAAEIDAEYKKHEEQQGGPEQFEQILQMRSQTRDSYRSLIELQLIVNRIFGEGVTVTEQQIDQFIEQNKDNIPAASEGATPADKAQLRNDVREQLLQEQINPKVSEWLKNTLQSDRVKRNP